MCLDFIVIIGRLFFMFTQNLNHYFSFIQEETTRDIENQKEDYLLQCSYDGLVDFFYTKHKLPNIDIADKAEYEWKDSTSLNDSFKFIVKYYIYSGKEMLNYKPSYFSLILSSNPYPTYKCDGSKSLLEWYEFSKSMGLDEVEEILSDEKKQEEFEKEAFRQFIDSWLRNIRTLNGEINQYNKELLYSIKSKITNVISLSQRKLEVRNKLKIGMMPISDIRNHKVKLNILEKKDNPKPVPTEPYYYISNEDYNLINQIIYRCMIQYERTPETFEDLDEEDIRNIILGAINANFEFDGTAESFSNVGHTDIMVQAKSKAAFIAECKFWKGKKYVSEAITQLLNYATYKDGKLSILVFNKDVANYDHIISEMDSLIREDERYISCIAHKETKWECIFKSNYENSVKLTFMLANYHFVSVK